MHRSLSYYLARQIIMVPVLVRVGICSHRVSAGYTPNAPVITVDDMNADTVSALVASVAVITPAALGAKVVKAAQ